MSIKDLSNKILDNIKEHDLKPKPKWNFLLKEYFIWFLVGLFMLIGAVSFSLIIYLIDNKDWDIYVEFIGSWWQLLLLSLPYLWLILLALFFILAYFNFKHTKTGYKFKIYYIIFASIIMSAILGGVFYQAGFAKVIDDIMADNIPVYNQFLHRRQTQWQMPEQGFLAGRIVKISLPETLVLEDFKDNEWTIYISDKTKIPFSVIKIDSVVRVLGVVKDIGTFEAFIIMPWESHREMFKKDSDFRERARELFERGEMPHNMPFPPMMKEFR